LKAKYCLLNPHAQVGVESVVNLLHEGRSAVRAFALDSKVPAWSRNFLKMSLPGSET